MMPEAQPFLCVLQQQWQRDFLAGMTQVVCFVDATGQTNKYGFCTYSFLFKVMVNERGAIFADVLFSFPENDAGQGVPIAYAICSSEGEDPLKEILRILKQRGLQPQVRTVFLEVEI